MFPVNQICFQTPMIDVERISNNMSKKITHALLYAHCAFLKINYFIMHMYFELD